MVATDISVFALQSAPLWEAIFRRRLSGASACRSYQLPFRDGSFDLVFAFQAAHHFRRHEATALEVFRVLRPGGVAIYLHEPTCPAWIHPLAVRRVRQGRPDVPEDVLIPSWILRPARAAGFRATTRDDCSLAKRGPLELLYYLGMRALPPLRFVLPCTRDFVLEKPARARA